MTDDGAGQHPVNFEFIVDYVRRLAPRGARVLDFGCGGGELVERLRTAGFDAYGADVFYEGGATGREGVAGLIARGLVREIPESSRLPFADDSFDVVVSNMVVEHVENLDLAVEEWARVLVADGRCYHQFPTREVLREDHVGVPLVHRLPPNRARAVYATLARRAGLGTYDVHPDPGEWARRSLAWIDRWCFYRPRRDVDQAFGARFEVRHVELAYISYRANRTGHPVVAALAESPAAPLLSRLFQRVGCACYELRRRPAVAPLGRVSGHRERG